MSSEFCPIRNAQKRSTRLSLLIIAFTPMTMKRLHVGMTVVRTRTDLFYFLRNWVQAHTKGDAYRSLSLPAELLDITSRVEYSWRWAWRPFFYRRVIRWLEKRLRELSKEANQFKEIILYLPDDGYWAELICQMQIRAGTHFRVFNVQHGLPLLSPVSVGQRLFRGVANRAISLVTGYPIFGFGFGAGRLNGYIVISPIERDYIKSNFGTPSYVMPQFTRGEFFECVKPRTRDRYRGPIRILVAFGPIFARDFNLFGGADRRNTEFLCDIASCLEAIKRSVDCDIVFRFHPGQDRQKALLEFHRAGLDAMTRTDENRAVLDSLHEADFVISYASTVLIEAWLLGVVPVCFSPVVNPPPPTTVPHEKIEFSRAVDGAPDIVATRGSLYELFSQETILAYCKDVSPPNYEADLPWLCYEAT